MSRLVQVWEQSYRFEEDELAFLAESQKLLSRPLRHLSQTDESPARSASSIASPPPPRDPAQDYAAILTDPTSEHRQIDQRADELHQRLKRRLQNTEALETLVATLQVRLKDLQDSHKLVKSKSLVMQSLWDGLVTRQGNYSRTIEKIKQHLAPYLQYEQIYQRIHRISSPPEAPLIAKEHLDGLFQTIQHLRQLKPTADYHLDAPLYLQRYQNLLLLGAKGLASSIIAEVENVTRKSSSRLRSARAKLQTILDINADFLVTLSVQNAPFMALYQCRQFEPELSKEFNNVAQRYFSCRSSLLHHFLLEWDEEDPQGNPDQLTSEMVHLLHQMPKEERNIAERLLGETLEAHFSSNFRQLLESSLVSFLKKLRSVFQECPAEHQRLLADQCLAEIRTLVQDTSNIDQKRVLAILTEFFAAALGTAVTLDNEQEAL